MTILQNRNQNTQAQIQGVNDAIAQLQEQLKNLSSEVRVLNQQHKAQENLSKEWNKQLESVKRLLKDSCSVYGDKEALQDMLEDVQELVLSVEDNFDEYAQSDRYLNQETADIEDELDPQLSPANNTQGELLLTAEKTVTKSELKSFWKSQTVIVQGLLRMVIQIPDNITTLTKVVEYLYSLGPTYDQLDSWMDGYKELQGKLQV